jgi:hypothetical protein
LSVINQTLKAGCSFLIKKEIKMGLTVSTAPASGTISIGSAPYGGIQGGATANILQPAVGGNTIQSAAPAAAPSGSSGGSGYSGSNSVGPNITALLNQISDQANNIVNNGNNTFSNSANNYQTQANALLSNIQTGQAGVNKEVQTAEMNKIQSMRGLQNDLANGLRSGAVQLAGGNALDSSAANALARAYSNYGNTQRGVIGQTEANALSQAQLDQNTVNQQQTQGLAQLQQMRNDAATQVGNDVATQLQNLDYQANNAGLTGKVDIQGMKQQVVNQGLAKLAAIDSWLQGQLGANTPQNVNDAAATAYGQLQQGASNIGGNATFDTNTTVSPVDAQGNPVAGAFDSMLPLYLRSNKQS